MFSLVTLLALEEEEDIRKQRAVRRSLRDDSNPLEIPNLLYVNIHQSVRLFFYIWRHVFFRFQQYYRVNKDVFKYLLELLEGDLPATRKSFAVQPIVKLGACLRFFAEGPYQKGVGNDCRVGLAQSSFSTVLTEVLNIFEEKLCPEWISWPEEQEKKEIIQKFYEKFQIPGVVGCIDGTHVKIIPPTNRHLYYNRKGNYSLNVLLVC